jgi:D-alanyl-D-alanine carboxypeptidase
MNDMHPLDERLAQIVNTDGAALASLAVVVVSGGESIYQGYFGNRYIDSIGPDQNLPVNGDTKFRIASISKSAVALAAMQLVERGLLDLDHDVSDYLGFTLRNPHYPDLSITPRMLLSHTSSIRDGSLYSIPLPYGMRDFFLPAGAFYNGGEHFAVPGAGIDPAPGRYFCYCNLNFGLMGAIIEAVSGERFDQYMRDHLLRPLGIDAGFNIHHISDQGFKNIAALYRRYDEEQWDPNGPWYPQVDDYRGHRPETVARIENPDTGDDRSVQPILTLDDYVLGTNGTLFSPQGGLRISAIDLAKIMQVFMNGGSFGDVVLVQPETVAAMQTIQWRYDAGAGNGDTYGGFMRAWGLGLQRITASGEAGNGDKVEESGRLQMWGHGGDAYGLLSGMWFDPDAKVGFVYIIGGVGANPEEHAGRYSSFARWEEQIMTAIDEQGLLDS